MENMRNMKNNLWSKWYKGILRRLIFLKALGLKREDGRNIKGNSVFWDFLRGEGKGGAFIIRKGESPWKFLSLSLML